MQEKVIEYWVIFSDFFVQCEFQLPDMCMKIKRKLFMYHAHRKRCSLLIPDYILPFYENSREKHGGERGLLTFLIIRFNHSKGRLILNNEISSTLEFQEKGLDLQRKDFWPIEDEWVQLKLLASSHNLSICAFFVLLLRLEMAGALDLNEKFDGVPRSFPKIILHQTITLYSVPRFTRLLYLRL